MDPILSFYQIVVRIPEQVDVLILAIPPEL